MKRLMKMFSEGSAIWRGWRMSGLMRVYVGECAGSHSVGKPWKKCIDTLKDCLKKKGFGCRASKDNGA